MQTNKKAFFLVYVLILVAMVLSLWVIVLNKQSYFDKNMQYTKINDILSKNIISKSNTSITNFLKDNSNNWLFIPILSCPEEVSYLSWSELLWTGKTFFENNFCSWTINSKVLNVFYSWSYDTFSTWSLWWTWFNLTWTNTLTWNLGEWYSVSFLKPIVFDERFVKEKLQISWYILKNNLYQNIFWNNSKINDFIDSDTLNILPFEKLSNTQSWVIYLEINDAFSWKIIEFDKNMFDLQNKLVKKDEIDFFSNSWINWYLQGDLSFNSSLWIPKVFDFKNKNYSIFLSSNTWSLSNIKYTFKVYTDTQTGVYINPVKNTLDKIEYLWNNVLKQDLKYYYKLQNIINYK